VAVATLTQEAVADLATRWTAQSPLVVIALCAEWCTTCGEFRRAFERLAAANGDAMFVWLDVEDDAAVCGDIDVENFPTLAIFRGETLLHYGVSLPAVGNVARLIAEMRTRTSEDAAAPEEVRNLPRSLREWKG
jgi:thioredoxin reductase (NADPH)